MSVKQAQAEIDSAEFSEWIAYHRSNPFTFNSVENILSIIASMVANGLSKKGSRTFKPLDFLPKLKTVKREDPKIMETKVKSIFKVKVNGNN